MSTRTLPRPRAVYYPLSQSPDLDPVRARTNRSRGKNRWRSGRGSPPLDWGTRRKESEGLVDRRRTQIGCPPGPSSDLPPSFPPRSHKERKRGAHHRGFKHREPRTIVVEEGTGRAFPDRHTERRPGDRPSGVAGQTGEPRR